MRLKFIENISNASTKATFNDKSVGHNCNCSAYKQEDDSIVVFVESNSERVNQCGSKEFIDMDDYKSWLDSFNAPGELELLVASLNYFGCSTSFDS